MNISTYRYRSAGYCIYCGSTTPPLSDEHIIPFALNGVLVIPSASCLQCANLTKKFEQIVARTIYGTFRLKRGYPTRRPKERPRTLPLKIMDVDGTRMQIDVPVRDFPDIFLAVDAPPPGILIGAAPTNSNPELKVTIKANPEQFSRSFSEIAATRIFPSGKFYWGALFLQLAKIAHCYAFACTNGREYVPLLPPLILGESDYLAHYVGGALELQQGQEAEKSDLMLFIFNHSSVDYLVVRINLLGIGTLYPYDVVAGKIPQIERFLSSLTSVSAD